MAKRLLTCSFGAVVVLGLTLMPASAQQDPNLTRRQASTDVPAPPDAFGTTQQDLWIAAPKFTGKGTSGGGDLSFTANHYYTNPGSPTPQTFWAQIDVPSGAFIETVMCEVDDPSVANNVQIRYRVSIHNTSTNAPGPDVVLDATSTGATGFQQPSILVSVQSQAAFVRYTNGTSHNLYYVGADIASDTRLRGCRVRWNRMVSPAPGTATFADVPVGSPLHQFVEALFAAGISGGCGGGNYCPDQPVTRGQMAVFLSAALGLHWPF